MLFWKHYSLVATLEQSPILTRPKQGYQFISTGPANIFLLSEGWAPLGGKQYCIRRQQYLACLFRDRDKCSVCSEGSFIFTCIRISRGLGDISVDQVEGSPLRSSGTLAAFCQLCTDGINSSRWHGELPRDSWLLQSSVLSLLFSRLFFDPMDCSLPGSMGCSRQEYWSGLPLPPLGDLPDPRMEPVGPVSPELAGGFISTHTTKEAPVSFT